MYQQLLYNAKIAAEAGYYRPKRYSREQSRKKFISHLRNRGHTLDEADRMWNYEEQQKKRIDLRKISKIERYRGLQKRDIQREDPNMEFHEYIYNKKMNKNETYKQFIDRMYKQYVDEIIYERAKKIPLPKLKGWEESLLRRPYAKN